MVEVFSVANVKSRDVRANLVLRGSEMVTVKGQTSSGPRGAWALHVVVIRIRNPGHPDYPAVAGS